MFDYNKNAFASAGWTACSREQFDQIVSDPLVAMVVDELATLAETCDAGRMDESIYQSRKASLKRRLPAFAFHAHFPSGMRKNEGAQPSGLCMIDLDHLMAPRTVWNQLHAAMQAETAQQTDPQSVASANDANVRDVPSRRATARVAPTIRENAPVCANDARQDSSFLIGSADTALARQSESELSLPSLTRSVPHSSLLLVHITPSGRGLRLVFRLPESYRCEPYSDHIAQFQEEITRWIESVIHEAGHSDPHVKDLARISFAVPRSYILYLNDNLFVDERGETREENGLRDADPFNTLLSQIGQAVAESASPPTPIAPFNEVDGLPVENEELGMRNEECLTANDPANPQDDAHPLRVANTNDPAANDANVRDVPSRRATARVAPTIRENDAANSAAASADPSFKGIPYSSIIAKYWQVMGGEPSVGERNTKLHQLAYHLRYICDFDANLLRQILPNYGLSDKEMHDLIQSALKAPRYSYSNVMNKVLQQMHLRDGEDSPLSSLGSPLETEDQPPQMPDDLPPLIELLVRYMPEAYKPAVAHGVFPPLATHLCDTRFRYIDNVDHEATLMCLLMAGSSAGKGCMQRPIEYIMADIRQRDNDNIAKEKEWKRTCNTLGSNERKPPRPEGLIIQEVDPDMTNPAFVMRMADAAPHPLYASMNEVEQFNNLRSSNGGKQQFQIMCYAFDPGNRYGQTRASSNAISEKVTVRFNWNASTTVTKGQRYFKSVVNDGPLSRINLCTIMPQAIGEQMPVYGIYPDDYPRQLQPYIENLCQAHGLIDIPQASQLAHSLVDHNALISSATQNRIYEQLSFRAAVIAWLKACLLFVAHGYYWDDRIDQFCLWSMDYDLWCKMRFFSQAMEEAMNSEQVAKWRKNNLLRQLPGTFTKEDVKRLQRKHSLKTPAAQMLNVWVNRNLIRRNADGTFQQMDPPITK